MNPIPFIHSIGPMATTAALIAGSTVVGNIGASLVGRAMNIKDLYDKEGAVNTSDFPSIYSKGVRIEGFDKYMRPSKTFARTLKIGLFATVPVIAHCYGDPVLGLDAAATAAMALTVLPTATTYADNIIRSSYNFINSSFSDIINR